MTFVLADFQVFAKPVGGRCNLNCSYCYYLEKQELHKRPGIMRMSDEMLDLYTRQNIEASGGSDIMFTWHGGEPLLAGLDFFRKAVNIQKKYKPHNRIILNGIQTNATLITEEWGEFFGNEQFLVGVSLDGPEKYHNIYRRGYGRKGSYSEVMSGLEILRSHNVTWEILCVVSNDNVHAPLELYDFFKSLGASFMTFLPLVNKVRKGSPEVSSDSVRAVDFGKFLSEIFDVWLSNDIGRVKVQIFEEALRTAFGQEHTLCIFRKVCGGVPVLEMNGDFYSCDHYVNSENLVGNISDRSVAEMLDSPQQKTFGQNKLVTLPRYCLECEVLDMCNGECPKNRFIITPDGESKLNYLCEGYRYFFSRCKPFVSEVARIWRGSD
jgi:uncharacterized protein